MEPHYWITRFLTDPGSRLQLGEVRKRVVFPLFCPLCVYVCVVSAGVVVVVARVLGIPIFGWGHYFVSSPFFPR